MDRNEVMNFLYDVCNDSGVLAELLNKDEILTIDELKSFSNELDSLLLVGLDEIGEKKRRQIAGSISIANNVNETSFETLSYNFTLSEHIDNFIIEDLYEIINKINKRLDVGTIYLSDDEKKLLFKYNFGYCPDSPEKILKEMISYNLLICLAQIGEWIELLLSLNEATISYDKALEKFEK